MAGHDHEDKQLHSPAGADVMQAIQDNAFNDISFEKMSIPYCRGSHEVEVMGVEVGLDRLFIPGIYAPAGSAIRRVT
jgi:hypothetical protein